MATSGLPFRDGGNAYWHIGKRVVTVRSLPDNTGAVDCSWQDGTTFALRRFPSSELLPLPEGLSSAQLAEYILMHQKW